MRQFCITCFLLLSTIFLCGNEKINELENSLLEEPEESHPQILNDLAYEYAYISTEKSREYAQKALDLAVKYENTIMEIDAKTYIGISYLFIGEFNSALNNYLTPALEQARAINYRKGISTALNSIGAIHYNLGDMNSSMLAFNEAYNLSVELEQFEQASMIQINIASIYTNWGMYDKAVEYMLSSLKFFEEANYPDTVSRIINNIAVTFHKWKNYSKSLEYYEKSLSIYLESGDIIGSAVPLNNIGEIYKDTGEYEKALEFFIKALEITKETENQQMIGVILLGIGEVYKETGKLGDALSYSKDALKIFEAMVFTEGIARAQSNLAVVYRKLRQYDKAIEEINKSMDMSKKNELIDLIQDNYKIMSEIYLDMADHKNAFTAFQKFVSLKDSVFTEESSRKISQLEILFETEKTLKENELLKTNNKIQALELVKSRNIKIFLIIVVALVFTIALLSLNRYWVIGRINLQLNQKNAELDSLNKRLEKALADVKKLGGMLPICSHCKNIRNDQGYWQEIETFIKENSDADFSHSICPNCLKEIYPDLAD